MQDLYTAYKDNRGFGLLVSIDHTPSHKNLESKKINPELLKLSVSIPTSLTTR